MSEDTTANAAAADSERSEGQDETEQKVAETPTEEGAKPDEGEGQTEGEGNEDGDDGEDSGEEGEGKRKRTRSERDKRKIRFLEAQLAERDRQSNAVPLDADDATLDRLVVERIGEPPKEEDFKDWFEYDAERNAYVNERRALKRELKGSIESTRKAGDTARQLRIAEYQDSVRELAKSVPDAIQAISNIPVLRPDIQDLVLEAEDAARLAYHLAKNPTEISRLNNMPPREAIKAVGRLEERLAKPEPRKATSAPPPIKSPNGSAGKSHLSEDARAEAAVAKLYKGR